MNNVSTVVTKLDFNFILDNFHRRKLWDKTWTIFEYGEMKTEISIASIQPRSGSVEFLLVTFLGDNIERTLIDISYKQDHRNMEAIHNRIRGAIVRDLNYIERRILRQTPEYFKAEAADESYESFIREEAEEVLDDNNITHDDIREAYIDSQVSKFASEYADDFLIDSKDTILYPYMLAVTSFMTPNKYDEMALRVKMAIGENKENMEKMTAEIERQLELIESKDMDELGIELEDLWIK